MYTSIHFISPTNQTVAKVRYHDGDNIEVEKKFFQGQGWEMISTQKYYQRIAAGRVRDRQLRVAYEVAAMWLYGQEYASTNLSAEMFFEQLDNHRRENVIRMVAEIADKLP